MRRLKELAGDPRFISGIFNYCDRWCERCPFTARCLTFATEQEYRGDEEEIDITNQKFWDVLHTMFEETKEMLEEMAAERGIVLDDATLEAAARDNEKDRHRRENHPLAKAAMAYAELSRNWFQQHKTALEELRAKAQDAIQTGLQEFDLHEVKASTLDAFAIIQWYQFFIGAKVGRSLSQTADEFIEIDDLQNDANGSAKIAMIAMQRSIAAWGRIREELPETEESVLPILLHLETLLRTMKREFPNAEYFIRPGFDELSEATVN